MVQEHQNYRSYLRAVLAERIAQNPAYSLRAFARDLKVHPSQLSAIFKGKKGISLKSALRVAQRLSLAAAATEYFYLLVQYESAPSEEMKDIVMGKLRGMSNGAPVKDLSVDRFKLIADWYHLPILEMTEIMSFSLTAK